VKMNTIYNAIINAVLS